MKWVIFKNLKGEVLAKTLTDSPADYIATCVSLNIFGVGASKQKKYNKWDEKPAAKYDEERVISEYDEILGYAGNMPIVERWVNLKASYTYEIVEQTSTEINAKIVESRVSEYPTIGDFLNSYFDGHPTLEELKQRRLDVKAKYPKV